jgi:hypothetical protein
MNFAPIDRMPLLNRQGLRPRCCRRDPDGSWWSSTSIAAAPGEAESIRAIETRPELKGAIFLTDDGDATYLATRRDHCEGHSLAHQ